MQEVDQWIQEHEVLIKKVIAKLKIYRDYEDYMQIGRIALWQAMENFDETKGEFAMFAYMTIKYALARALTKTSTIATYEINVEDDAGLVNLQQPLPVPQLLAWPEWFYLLSREDQFLLTAIFQEDLPLKAIAEKYHLSYETVKKRRQRLFAKLKAEAIRGPRM